MLLFWLTFTSERREMMKNGPDNAARPLRNGKSVPIKVNFILKKNS